MKLSTSFSIAAIVLSVLVSTISYAADTAPVFVAPPSISGIPQVGIEIHICATATDPQGLPLTYTYNYGDSTIDSLGKHTYLTAGVFTVTVTVSNGVSSTTATFPATIIKFANLWIKKLSVKQVSAGKDGWSAQYIYNADRTLAHIFDPAKDTFVASLGLIPLVQVPANVAGALRFTGVKPKYTFKSAKGALPVISVTFDESSQTITVSAASETFADEAGVLPATLQLGNSRFYLDVALDAKGKFTAISGYRSTSFVVSTGSIKIVKPGKDSATFSLYLGDPAFAYPGANGVKEVRVRVTSITNQVLFDKDLTSIVSSSAGKLKSGKDTTAPVGKFTYDSNKGKMTFAISKATLTEKLTTSEEHVKVDVLIGTRTYTTHVTLFASKAGSYSTKLPKKFTAFVAGKTTDTTAPVVISTIPTSAGTGVVTNSKVSATFSEAMDPWTLNATTFTLMQDAAAIPGTVTYAVSSATAVFTPSSNLAPNTTYTAMIKTAAADLSGNTLGCTYLWNFTTGAMADTTQPTVLSTNPADKDKDVAVNRSVNATFDKAMDPATINSSTFMLNGPDGKALAGTITYDANTRIVTFTPDSELTINTLYTSTLTTGIKDQAGNALAANKVWSFATGAKKTITPVSLGSAAALGTFGGGAGMTNQGLFTVVNGDISTTGESTKVTGFHDNVGDIYTETPLNKGQVNGRIYTAPPAPGGAAVGGNASTFAIATQGALDAQDAYNKLTPASMPGGIDPGAGQLGGLTLPTGIYQSASGSFLVTGSDLTLDAKGDANAVWVFQMASSLTVGGPGAPRNVNLINGAQAKNVFWQVGSSATINAAGGGTMVGTIIASSGIAFSTADNVILVTLNGRALSLNASTTLVNTIINVPAP